MQCGSGWSHNSSGKLGAVHNKWHGSPSRECVAVAANGHEQLGHIWQPSHGSQAMLSCPLARATCTKPTRRSSLELQLAYSVHGSQKREPAHLSGYHACNGCSGELAVHKQQAECRAGVDGSQSKQVSRVVQPSAALIATAAGFIVSGEGTSTQSHKGGTSCFSYGLQAMT